MKRILCWFGFHNWYYYPRMRDLPCWRRECRRPRCGEYQYRVADIGNGKRYWVKGKP